MWRPTANATSLNDPHELPSTFYVIHLILPHTQETGQFIVTFPKAFHAGFSYGHNVAEAVNFSPPVWLSYGREAVERYRGFARPSVFSHDRLVLTLANNLSKEWSLPSLKALLTDLTRIVKEEEHKRLELKKAGLRFGVISTSKLLANNLSQMDNNSLDYDEKRVCFNCRHICFMSAVACECNAYNVSCLREAAVLCDCKMQKRYLLAWHEIGELWEMVRKVEDFIAKSTTSWNKTEFIKEEAKANRNGSSSVERCVALNSDVGRRRKEEGKGHAIKMEEEAEDTKPPVASLGLNVNQ